MLYILDNFQILKNQPHNVDDTIFPHQKPMHERINKMKFVADEYVCGVKLIEWEWGGKWLRLYIAFSNECEVPKKWQQLAWYMDIALWAIPKPFF